MLNIDMINSTISELESGDTTYDSCLKLASLYVVKEHFNPNSVSAKEEKTETATLPQYRTYCDEKRRYQMKQSSTDCLCDRMKDVCKDIKEFIETLYNNTECPDERKEIEKLINDLYSHYVK